LYDGWFNGNTLLLSSFSTAVNLQEWSLILFPVPDTLQLPNIFEAALIVYAVGFEIALVIKTVCLNYIAAAK